MDILAEYGPNSIWEMMLDDAGLFGVARQAAEAALKRKVAPPHTCEDDFQHFLSYSQLSNDPPEVIQKMRLAFAAAWEVENE